MDIPNDFKNIKSFDVKHTPIIGAFVRRINLSSAMDRALDTKMEASPGKIVKVLILDTLAERNTLYNVSNFSAIKTQNYWREKSPLKLMF
jgi:hypothetical protein